MSFRLNSYSYLALVGAVALLLGCSAQVVAKPQTTGQKKAFKAVRGKAVSVCTGLNGWLKENPLQTGEKLAAWVISADEELNSLSPTVKNYVTKKNSSFKKMAKANQKAFNRWSKTYQAISTAFSSFVPYARAGTLDQISDQLADVGKLFEDFVAVSRKAPLKMSQCNVSIA